MVIDMRLLLIYKKLDALRNKRFIEYLQESAKKKNIDLNLVFYEDLTFESIENVDGIINRTNEFDVSKHFETLGIRCFNNSFLTEVANNKRLCYEYVSKSEVPFLPLYEREEIIETSLPLVVKNPKGRGGNEVFLVKNIRELNDKISLLPEYIIQKYGEGEAKDVRVYVIGNKIVKALLRKGVNDFRANYSISKQAEVYSLSKKEEEIVYRVINMFNIDYAGIDFLIDKDGNFWFNEIEDSVGARALYEITNLNIASLYIDYIYKELKKHMN